jgi:DNA-binding transcriptional LysR family regulator
MDISHAQMNTKNDFDWSQIQVFLAVAETGSLSGAARLLGVSQPTVGRHIHAMEASGGTALFQRQARGMQLTEAGMALLPPARQMRDAAQQLQLRAAGIEDTVAGTVRITASVFASHHVLPPIIANLRRHEPDIAIELVPSDATENLLFREADIAVRMYRPTQMEVVTRKIGELPLGVFGAKAYLDRAGRPKSREDLLEHEFVGYDSNEEILRGFRAQGVDVTRDFFKTRCDQQTVYWELVRAGCGLGFAQVDTVKDDPLVEQVFADIDVPSLEVWLTTHEAVRHTPRVGRVWAMLADALTDVCRPTR